MNSLVCVLIKWHWIFENCDCISFLILCYIMLCYIMLQFPHTHTHPGPTAAREPTAPSAGGLAGDGVGWLSASLMGTFSDISILDVGYWIIIHIAFQNGYVNKYLWPSCCRIHFGSSLWLERYLCVSFCHRTVLWLLSGVPNGAGQR